MTRLTDGAVITVVWQQADERAGWVVCGPDPLLQCPFLLAIISPARHPPFQTLTSVHCALFLSYQMLMSWLGCSRVEMHAQSIVEMCLQITGSDGFLWLCV